MNDKLIKEIIEYVEDAELIIEQEYGANRSLDEIKAEGDMPDLYKKLLDLV